jgi:ABC-type transport system substrate-binding protein
MKAYAFIKKAFLLLVVVIIFGLSSCEEDSVPGNGTIEITLYSEGVKTLIEDGTYDSVPALVDDWGISLASIVSIEGLPAEAPEYYMGDKYGVISIAEVPEGSYTVHPVFMTQSMDITAEATGDEIAEYEIIIPDLTIHGYMVRAGLEDADFHRAMAIGIDRSELLADAGLADSTDPAYTELYSALPSGLFNDSLYTREEITESVSTAESLFNDRVPVDLTILYNTSDTNTAVANELGSQLDVYPEIGTVTVNGQIWRDYNLILAALDYHIARVGWSFDSNNPLAWIAYIFRTTGYSSTEYDELKADIEAAQESQDADTFLLYLNQIHSLLMDEGLFIPLYEY